MSTRSGQHSSGKSGRKSGKGSSKESGKDSQHNPGPQEQQLCLYIAIYDPSEGHYYHQAITIFDETTGEWHTYEVIRSYAGRPFTAHYLVVDPRSSNRCRQPLIYLTTQCSASLDIIIEVITGVLVEADLNQDCQNYILDIINALRRDNFVSEAEYQAAWAQAYPFYGYIQQDFGAQQPAADDQRILSEEYVYDSDNE